LWAYGSLPSPYWVILADGSEWFVDLCTELGTAGVSGLVLFGVVAMLTCVAFVPVTVLALAAGFLFGIMPGALTVSVSGTLGAGLAFLLGRTLLRPWVESQMSRRPRCCALVKAVERQGFQVVFVNPLCRVVYCNFHY
jgi:uncharacterized membrane protein YdjX (TVP38/TMEM64 family)